MQCYQMRIQSKRQGFYVTDSTNEISVAWFPWVFDRRFTFPLRTIACGPIIFLAIRLYIEWQHGRKVFCSVIIFNTVFVIYWWQCCRSWMWQIHFSIYFFSVFISFRPLPVSYLHFAVLHFFTIILLTEIRHFDWQSSCYLLASKGNFECPNEDHLQLFFFHQK